MNDSDNLPNVLFTTELSKKQIQRLESDNFTISSIPFITFEYFDVESWRSQIPAKYDSWVFTSKRAVKAIKPSIKSLLLPENTFAVGEKTAQKLQELSLSPITPNQFNLESLAELMNKYELKNIIHFCGNLKSGDLSELLEDKTVNLTSIEVYRTKFTPYNLNLSEFDAIVFMSPSAVESFYKENSFPHSNVFCIGPSTANALEEKDIVDYQMAEESTLDSLAETINTFYS